MNIVVVDVGEIPIVYRTKAEHRVTCMCVLISKTLKHESPSPINLVKYDLAQQEVEYLGHIVDKQGIRNDIRKDGAVSRRGQKFAQCALSSGIGQSSFPLVHLALL
jgi:hypothetical protein